MTMHLDERRKIEIDYWRDNSQEKPGADSLENQLDKQADALIFREAVRLYQKELLAARTVVELGAGQGWASCVVKRLFPDSHVTATDISEFAIASIERWERIYGVELDATAVCTSDQMPFEDGSVDVVFCFAAAHHFVTHSDTFKELYRVLKPGGTVLYIYEPTSPRFLYKAAVKRVNNKRPDVPEDVLVPSQMRSQAEQCGFGVRIQFWPNTLKRGRVAGLYFGVLSLLPFLCRFVPCTANLVFRKTAK